MTYLLLLPSIVCGVLLCMIETKTKWYIVIPITILSTLLAVDIPSKIALSIFLPVLVLIDKEKMLLPFLYSIPLLFITGMSNYQNWWVAIILGLVHFVCALLGKMGGGDWPVATAIGFMQGEIAPLSLFIGGAIVLVYAFVRRLSLHEEIPMGPLYFFAGGVSGGIVLHILRGVVI